MLPSYFRMLPAEAAFSSFRTQPKLMAILQIMTFNYQSGMEVAAYLSDKAVSVSVIGSSKFPFQSSLGPAIGKMTMQVSEHCGIFFHFWFTAICHLSQVIHLL